MNKRTNDINELKIKLLPEKAKRDYVLRLVSSIIVMIFVIINFFVIFLPRLNLLSDANNVRRRIYYLESQYANYFEQLNKIDRELYNINKNTDVLLIEENQMDYNNIYDKIIELQPTHSFIQNINYDSEKGTLLLSMQFDTNEDLYQFLNALNHEDQLKYFASAEISSRSKISIPDGYRENAVFIIHISPSAPKVGGSND